MTDEEKLAILKEKEKTYLEGLKAKSEEVPYEGVPKNIQEAMKSGEGFVHKKELDYTFEELKEAWNNPKPMTKEEIKNTFIDDDREIDLSGLKL